MLKVYLRFQKKQKYHTNVSSYEGDVSSYNPCYSHGRLILRNYNAEQHPGNYIHLLLVGAFNAIGDLHALDALSIEGIRNEIPSYNNFKSVKKELISLEFA